MCQVELSVCKVCARMFAAQMSYCPPVDDVVGDRDPAPFDIHSSFHWSPMDGCTGLQIQPTANLGDCGSDHQGTEDAVRDRRRRELGLLVHGSLWPAAAKHLVRVRVRLAE
ncbi:Uncharacterized protein TPAR_04304 [Tolypocladium paradoxum]|uniref:Uncharacterized protein n=1 Tax=Tolypocladium paradoxum TaxID=94208 RepID=A0A2S4KZ81_9HYPO|nr:Uncharacterized protein TPAR_04304 [Tolypocladium paradoxum]